MTTPWKLACPTEGKQLRVLEALHLTLLLALSRLLDLQKESLVCLYAICLECLQRP